MYACKQCGTGNPLDSSFCKKCGSALPADEVAEARVKLNEMLEEGNNLFTDGRTDEAMLIAEAAVNADPSSHMAHSLKGLCHERVSQIAEALECYEAAVGLNPDSSLDKVKVAALRNRLAQRVTDLPEPNRRSAALMAVAAMVLCLVGGGMAAIGMNGRHEPAKVAANVQQTPIVPEFNNPPAIATPPVQTPANTGTGTPTTTGTGATSGIPGLTGPFTGVLPQAGGNGEIELDPLNPPAPTPSTAAGPKKAEIDTPPGPLVSSGNPEAAKPAEDEGYIHIEKSGAHHSTPGGGEPVDDGHEVATVLQAAQELYQLGHYDQAASKYGKVAQMGGNTGRIQQRLGDCYRNLGKAEQSRSAYNKAINLYQTQIKLGHDVAGNQRGLDTCESALKVLGG